MRCCHGIKKVCGGGCPSIYKIPTLREQNRTEYVSHVFLQLFPGKLLSRKNCEAFDQHTFKLCHEIISRTPAKLSLHVGFCHPYPPTTLKHDRPLFEYFIRQSHGFQKMRGEEKQMVPRHIMTYQ